MESNKIQRENRKALPKFFLTLLAAAVFGGVVGFLAATGGESGVLDALPGQLNGFFRAAAPWGLGLCCVAFPLWGGVCYSRSRREFESWDQEDEDVVERVEQRLNWPLLAVTLQTVLSFFLFAAAAICAEDAIIGLPVSVLLFLVGMAEGVILQQKVVDLEKRINPEKRGCVYDHKFQKTWLQSCDEAELRQIGQAAYQAFRVLNGLCVALWLVLLVGNMVFHTGLFPVFVVSLIWGVSQVTYIAACMRQGRRRKKLA